MVDLNKATALRLQGCTYKQISLEMGCSVAWCKKNLKDIHKHEEPEPVVTSARPLKFMRTTITLENGTIQPARINIDTGEIKLYKYKSYDSYNSIKVTGKMDNTSIPFWMLDKRYFNDDLIAYLDSPVDVVRVKTSYKTNNIKEFLDNYLILDEAKDDIPQLDNIITGVSNLGASNPISHNLLFHLLQNLNSLDFNSIKDATGYSNRFCYKLVEHLTVLSNALEAEIPRIL